MIDAEQTNQIVNEEKTKEISLEKEESEHRVLKVVDGILNFFYTEKHTGRMAILTFYVAFIVAGICYFISTSYNPGNDETAKQIVRDISNSIAYVDLSITIIYWGWFLLSNVAKYRLTNEFHKKIKWLKIKLSQLRGLAAGLSTLIIVLIIIGSFIVVFGVIGITIWNIIIIATNGEQFKTFFKWFKIFLYITSSIILLSVFVKGKVNKIHYEARKNNPSMIRVFKMNQHKEIINVINNYQAIIMETDTIMGIMSKNLDLIYKIKNRPINKKIVTFINDYRDIPNLNGKELRIIRQYWPGALTIIKNKISYRQPNHKELLKILKAVGAVYCSSANLSGEEVIKDHKEACEKFSRYASELVIVEGHTIKDAPSTIIDFDDKKVIREGLIPSEPIMKILNEND